MVKGRLMNSENEILLTEMKKDSMINLNMFKII